MLIMLKTQRKKANANFLAGYQDLFRCPLCASEMKLVDLKSLICTNNHCYDLARQGYVNMLSHALKQIQQANVRIQEDNLQARLV